MFLLLKIAMCQTFTGGEGGGTNEKNINNIGTNNWRESDPHLQKYLDLFPKPWHGCLSFKLRLPI